MRAVLIPLILSLIASSALASDGVLEINQTCALQTGCFPGDAPGLPVTITTRGSYRLTSGLAQSSIFNANVNTDTIEIGASEVTLDLNGFAIRCSASAPASDTCPGSAKGITTSGSSLRAVRVLNGIVRGMPDSGIFISAIGSVIEGVTAIQNGSHGIRTGGIDSVIRNCTAIQNGGNGHFVFRESLVEGCVTRSNGGLGIDAGFFPVSIGYRGCIVDSVVGGITNLGGNAIFP